MSEPPVLSSSMASRWFLLTILTGSYGAGAFGVLGISPLSSSLVAGFGLTRLQVALLVPAIYLGGLLFSLPGGRLADRVGARPSLLGGLMVGAAGLAVGSLSPSFTTFLLCLFPAGIGWSVVNPALGKAIMDLFPARERGIAMGIKVGIFFVISAELGGARTAGLLSDMAFASIVIGLLVGPAAFGLLLVHWDSYAAPWTAFAALSAIAAAASLTIAPALARARR